MSCYDAHENYHIDPRGCLVKAFYTLTTDQGFVMINDWHDWRVGLDVVSLSSQHAKL